MLEIDNKTRKRLAGILAGDFSVLIVEDHELVRKAITLSISGSFPRGTVRVFKGFSEEDIEQVIKDTKPTIALLDGDLDTWGSHSKYGTFGYNLIPFIKEVNPDSFIISISIMDINNEIALQKGADLICPKGDITDLFYEFI